MATKTFTGTGLASTPARWSGGTLPIAGDNIVIAAGADCTLDGAYSWGSGTSSTTLASNAIVVSGTLRGHATTPWSLTCVGSIVEGPGGSILFDQSAGGSGTLILNSGGTVGQHGFVTLLGAGQSCSLTIKGIARTRNTTLTSPTSAGATSMQVAGAANWAVGDALCIASETEDPDGGQFVTVSSVSGLTIGFTPALAVARTAGRDVGNFTSNMVVKSSSSTAPAIFSINAALSTSSFASITYSVHSVQFDDIASNAGWSSASINAPQYYGLSIVSGNSQEQYITNCSIRHTFSTSYANSALFATSTQALNYSGLSGCALHSAGAAGYGYFFASSSNSRVLNSVIYRSFQGYASTFSAGGIGCQINGGKILAKNNINSLNAGSVVCNDVDHRTPGVVCLYVSGSAQYNSGTIYAGTRWLTHSANAQSGTSTNGTALLGAATTGDNTTGPVPSQSSRSMLYAIGGVSSNNIDINYHRVVSSDTTIRRRGTFSIKINPKVANTAIIYTFTLPAVSGVAQVIKGSLRFDVTYGAATPPVIALSGQGVTASYTCAAIADVWDDFTLSFTPTSTGDITVTITVQSASTAGYAWLDGVYHYPMIQAVRHWGYQWLPQAAQLVDARITLTEAAALALPVAVNHSLSTVTISGAVTPGEALQAMLADLAQTSNNATPVHVTGDGSTFSTAYTVVLSGSGAVSGPYTDATGLHVSVTSSALDAGTLVQVWDVAASTELYIGTPSGALSLPIIYPGADKTLRLRAMQCGASSASLFIEQLGTLTSAGASFLVTQSPDSVYAANAIDGSAVTGITIDDTLMRFVLSGRTSISWAEIYAYEAWWLSTVAGMRDDGRIITAIDPANYVLAGFQLRNDNPGGAPITLTGGWGRDSVTGQTITLIDTTGGPIFAAPDAVISYGQSAATPAEIWSHTSRTLTGTTSADVRYVNGVQIIGSGVAGDTWGPA